MQFKSESGTLGIGTAGQPMSLESDRKSKTLILTLLRLTDGKVPDFCKNRQTVKHTHRIFGICAKTEATFQTPFVLILQVLSKGPTGTPKCTWTDMSWMTYTGFHL